MGFLPGGLHFYYKFWTPLTWMFIIGSTFYGDGEKRSEPGVPPVLIDLFFFVVLMEGLGE